MIERDHDFEGPLYRAMCAECPEVGEYDDEGSAEDWLSEHVCADRCRGCGCLWDDHQSRAELLATDDPLVLAQIYGGGGGPFNYCGDCADCEIPRDSQPAAAERVRVKRAARLIRARG